MSVIAYVLIQTEVGRSEKVASSARALTGVIDADNVAGPYDVIVKVEADSLDELGPPRRRPRSRRSPGITRTFTCPIVNL